MKYKVWDKKTKKMRKIHSIAFDDNGNIKLVNMWGKDIIEQKDIVIKREKDYELLPSTGVKDINKKESYSGHILKEPVNSRTKEREKRSFGIVKKERNSNNLYVEWNYIKLFEGEEVWLTNDLPITHIDRYEIVGNIFENPDMIKKEV